MKLTYQITGSIALLLWAVILFIPDASTGATSVLTNMHWWFAGKKFVSFQVVAEFLVMTLVLIGYAAFAFRMASQRERADSQDPAANARATDLQPKN